MHRGCVPFINPRQFDSHYWPTLRPIIEEFWKRGHQTLFYAEGKWAAHLDSFRELPARSIVFHADRDDVFAVRRTLGDRFAISGACERAPQLRPARRGAAFCRRVIDEVAPEAATSWTPARSCRTTPARRTSVCSRRPPASSGLSRRARSHRHAAL